MLGNRDCFGKIWVSSRIDLGDERMRAFWKHRRSSRNVRDGDKPHTVGMGVRCRLAVVSDNR